MMIPPFRVWYTGRFLSGQMTQNERSDWFFGKTGTGLYTDFMCHFFLSCNQYNKTGKGKLSILLTFPRLILQIGKIGYHKHSLFTICTGHLMHVIFCHALRSFSFAPSTFIRDRISVISRLMIIGSHRYMK